jgi:hypothetical protein
MVLAVAVLVWAAAFVTRPRGGLILLLLVAALFVAGGGFTTLWFGLLAAIAATQITAPPTRWRTWLGPRVRRLVARLWPWLFLAYLAWAAGSWIVAAISNAVMLRLTPAVTAATPFVLALILLSALAHDSQQSQAAPPAGAADHLGGQPPGKDDMDQHEAIPIEHVSADVRPNGPPRRPIGSGPRPGHQATLRVPYSCACSGRDHHVPPLASSRCVPHRHRRHCHGGSVRGGAACRAPRAG